MFINVNLIGTGEEKIVGNVSRVHSDDLFDDEKRSQVYDDKTKFRIGCT